MLIDYYETIHFCLILQSTYVYMHTYTLIKEHQYTRRCKTRKIWDIGSKYLQDYNLSILNNLVLIVLIFQHSVVFPYCSIKSIELDEVLKMVDQRILMIFFCFHKTNVLRLIFTIKDFLLISYFFYITGARMYAKKVICEFFRGNIFLKKKNYDHHCLNNLQIIINFLYHIQYKYNRSSDITDKRVPASRTLITNVGKMFRR